MRKRPLPSARQTRFDPATRRTIPRILIFSKNFSRKQKAAPQSLGRARHAMDVPQPKGAIQSEKKGIKFVSPKFPAQASAASRAALSTPSDHSLTLAPIARLGRSAALSAQSPRPGPRPGESGRARRRAGRLRGDRSRQAGRPRNRSRSRRSPRSTDAGDLRRGPPRRPRSR